MYDKNKTKHAYRKLKNIFDNNQTMFNTMS